MVTQSSSAALDSFSYPFVSNDRRSTLEPIDGILQSVARLPRSEDLAIFQSLPDVKCHVCSKIFESVEFVPGRWGHPGFDMESKTCTACMEKAEIAIHLSEHITKAAIPLRYYNASFETFNTDKDNQATFEFCHNYTLKENKQVGLYLHGPCGIGKTHLAVAVIRAQILKGFSAFFIETPSLLFALRKTFSNDSTMTDEEQLQRYLSYSFLMLDDFGVEKSSEWVRQTLDYIIYHRDARMKPVIITSNLDPEGIKKKHGNRIVSRIKGMCHILKMDGVDRRLSGPCG